MKIAPIINSYNIKPLFIKNVSCPIFKGAQLKPLEKDIFVKSPAAINSVKETENKRAVFAKHLQNKMEDMLDITSKEDIEKIVDKLHLETGMEKEKICEIISRLTQFSSYGELPSLQRAIKPFTSSGVYDPIAGNLSINDVIKYLSGEKEQLHFNPYESNSVLFIDEATLQKYEKHKKSKDPFFNSMLNNIKKRDVHLVLIDGLCAKVDGVDVSQTIFGAPLSLEDSTRRVIKKMQEGTPLGVIMNTDLVKKTRDVFGEDVPINILKNDKAYKNDPQNIAERMKPLYPSAKYIENTIDSIITGEILNNVFSKEEAKTAEKLLSEYFDSMVDVYSAQSINRALKSQYKKIESFMKKQGKTMDDVFYMVPNRKKSFALIAYNYAKANNIDLSNFVTSNGKCAPSIDVDNKTAVILDDFAGSGESLVRDEFNYPEYLQGNIVEGDKQVIFAPISIQDYGLGVIKTAINHIPSNFKKGRVIYFSLKKLEEFSNSLSEDEEKIFRAVSGRNPSDGFCSCTAFPYMIPDNNTNASGFLLNPCLNNQKGNKSTIWVNKYL